MIQKSLFVIVFYYVCCSQAIASQDAPSLEKRLISSHSMPTSVIKLNNERALENNFETFLNLGDRHPMLSEVKHRLYPLGYLKQDRSAKNTFSKVLFSAFSQFQKHHGLNPDEIIGIK